MSPMTDPLAWSNAQRIESKKFTCGFCDSMVASDVGYFGKDAGGRVLATVHVCPHCTLLSLFAGKNQVPGPKFGAPVERLPGQVEPLYGEVRRAMAVSAYTVAVLGCRKILAHVAVDQGAKEGLNFLKYVDYLADEGLRSAQRQALVGSHS
jgi:hypothetical protein